MKNPLRPLLDLVDALIPPTCVACETPSDSILCAACDESVLAPPTGVLACAMFGGPIASALRVAKFRPDATAAESLGRLWVERIVAGTSPAIPNVDAVAFVPAPYRRRLKRGFDLPAVLASALARHAKVPLLDAIACSRHDEPLSFGADKATRATAVAGRYRVRTPTATNLEGKRVLLVDDVKTTGATLSECARALEQAGAVVVQAPFAIAP